MNKPESNSACNTDLFRVLITEENVDGCRGYAQVMVLFNRSLTDEEQAVFQCLLLKTKREAAEADDCLDTEDIVNAALHRFQKTASGSVCRLADAFLTF